MNEMRIPQPKYEETRVCQAGGRRRHSGFGARAPKTVYPRGTVLLSEPLRCIQTESGN